MDFWKGSFFKGIVEVFLRIPQILFKYPTIKKYFFGEF